MIPLPSGKVAGISNIRARYHAIRLNREVRTDTSHRDLYGFVDIVVKPGRLQSIPYQPSFLFSGYTLADLHLTLWTASDRKAFNAWIQQEQQFREIEQVRKRLIGDEFRLTEREYDYPKRLYSCLQNKLEQVSLKRASPEQWRRTVLNMTRSGIREDEITWSGLLPFLDSMEKETTTLSREQLLARLDFSIIRLSLTNELVTDHVSRLEFCETPTSKLINHSITPRTITEPSECCVLRYVDPVHYYKVGYLKKQKSWDTPSSSQKWFALDSMGNPIGDDNTNQHHYSTKEQAFSAASRCNIWAYPLITPTMAVMSIKACMAAATTGSGC